MLVTSKQLVLDAQRGGYAVGCFNTSDIEITKAIIGAAEAQKAPVIVATSEKAIEYAGLEALAAAIRAEAEKSSVPVALHLDHGKSLQMVDKCLTAGFTSVMIDGSSLPYEENMALTFQASVHAHANDVPCEGELGSLGKAGQSESRFTDPEEVSVYVHKTQIDFLAPSIGSKHGAGDDEHLNIELLKKIRSFTDVPLVLHGGSGVPDEDIQVAIKNGISKINIDTDIRHAFTKELREILDKFPDEQDPRVILEKVIIEVQKYIENKIKLFGSNNKI